MSKKRVSFELTSDELGGLDLSQVKCAACSGYGNCGYRMYRLKDGKPVAICQLKKKRCLRGLREASKHVKTSGIRLIGLQQLFSPFLYCSL